MTSKTRVLFICTANAARSQMAEGLLRAKYGDRFEVFSAGTRLPREHPRNPGHAGNRDRYLATPFKNP